MAEARSEQGELTGFDHLRMVGSLAMSAGAAALAALSQNLTLKAKGPAEAATSPEPGSTNPQQEMEMNEAHATTTPANPASAVTPYELAYEAAMQSKLAERLADDLIGSRLPSFQGTIQLTPYEADVLMYAIHQARNSAIRVQEAL